MKYVYRVGGAHGVEYFDTAKEADRCKPDGEEPEEVTRMSAARECDRLMGLVNHFEEGLFTAQQLLAELLASCDPDTADTRAGRAAKEYLISVKRWPI